MNYLFIITILFSGFAANASPEICLTSVTTSQQGAMIGVEHDLTSQSDLPEFVRVSEVLSCQDIKQIQNKVTVASMLVSTGGIVGAVCAGPMGAAVAVVSSLTEVGLTYLNYKLGNLPCEDGKQVDQEKVAQRAAQLVCEEMARNGHDCDPSQINLEVVQ